MRIGIIGINHKSAHLPLREKLAQAANNLCPDFSFVLLSTCNRTEVYFHSEDPTEAHTFLINSLRFEIEEEFEHRIYSYFGSDCFFHLARVTAGIDSALIGETEIQGQVKRAYETACEARPLSSTLHFLFQKSLKIGKSVRANSQWTKFALSIEEALLHATLDACDAIHDKKVLIVGLSEINHKSLKCLRKGGVKEITLCNRTHSKAQAFAAEENISLLHWDKLDAWPQFDIVICGTKSPHFLLRPTSFSPQKKQLLIDLSVPRNIDPKLAYLPHINLLNIDHLNQALDRTRQQKAAEIARIETHHIAEAVETHLALYKLRSHYKETLPLAHVS